MEDSDKKRLTALALFAAGTAFLAYRMNKKEDAALAVDNLGKSDRLTSKANFYERYIKRGFDVAIAGFGLVFAAPVIAVASVIVFLEDPGDPIFVQKRVGINGGYFNIHKLRTMKKDSGDIPTHLLSKEDQEKLILKSGRFFRKYSIDELPQLIDILRNRMTLVGPRPALWNQDDLIAERDRYNANSAKPGLTGWAQINGRDEIEIPLKAKLDGEYVAALRKNSFSAFFMDLRCVIGTVSSVLTSKGVAEGGTGNGGTKYGRSERKNRGIRIIDDLEESLDGYEEFGEDVPDRADRKNEGYDEENDEFLNILKKDLEKIENRDSVTGFGKKTVVPDLSKKRKVLLTGKDSYIGRSFIKYAGENYPGNFEIDELDMRNDSWRDADFSKYDIVWHLAGIAHVDNGEADKETARMYYRVNTELAVEAAEKAKREGVKEFIFMSSIIIYGNSAPYGKKRIIEADEKPSPATVYGDSKWQADKRIRSLADGNFRVAILRPPFVYGPGCKGNYNSLAALARKLPVFPMAGNRRSMLYIGNLCEFIAQLMLVDESEFSGKGNIFFPQNGQYTGTFYMADRIHRANTGHAMLPTNLFNPALRIISSSEGKIGQLANKAFGNMCYAKEISVYPDMDYIRYSLAESIENTEKPDKQDK